MKLLLSLILRIARGERLEKATPQEKSWGAFMLLVIPAGLIFFLLMSHYAKPFIRRIDSASPMVLWIVYLLIFSALICGSFLWHRIVPLKATVIGAVIAWIMLLWVLLYLGLWDFGKL